MADNEEQDVLSLPLLGDEDANMDDKGRVLVGTKLRKRLGANFAMCLGANGCITVYRNRTWRKMCDDLLSRDPRVLARQDYGRMVMANADDELDFDAQGRVVIPHKLRVKAEIKDKVKILGCGDYIEIWAKDCYDIFIKHGVVSDKERQEKMNNAFERMTGINPNATLAATMGAV